jgi:hydroxymethylbilane synthase
MTIRIGTRGSPLALVQANETKARLATAHGLDPAEIEIVVISTTGDRVRDRPLAEIGGKGLFTKELEDALLAGSIDLAVHSMKDVPAHLPGGLEIAAVLPREDPRDAFISLRYSDLKDMPQGAVLGSSSVRRTAQALRTRPDLKSVQFRGNVDTRLRKLGEGVADATFLACAGLNRLGLRDKITKPMGLDEMLPAVTQGIVAIEIASRNEKIRPLLAAIHHEASGIAAACERGFLATLDGSCRTPLAGHAELRNGEIIFHAEALSLDGVHCFTAQRTGNTADAAHLGRDAGEEIKHAGGALLTLA